MAKRSEVTPLHPVKGNAVQDKADNGECVTQEADGNGKFWVSRPAKNASSLRSNDKS